MTTEQDPTRLERRLIELESLLAEVGAEHRPDGWFWPFYRPPGQPDLMMPTQQWIDARRHAARDLLSASARELAIWKRAVVLSCDSKTMADILSRVQKEQ